MSNKNSYESWKEDQVIESGWPGLFLLIGGLGWGLWVTFSRVISEIMSFKQQTFPINLCYQFYYFTLIYPYNLGTSIFGYISSELTQYPNLNGILCTLFGFLYVSAYIFLWYLLIIPSKKIRLIWLCVFFTPVTVSIGAHLVRWLFTTKS